MNWDGSDLSLWMVCGSFVTAGLLAESTLRVNTLWIIARIVSAASVVLVLTSALLGHATREGGLLTLSMTALVSTIGAVVVDYSYRYLRGEPRQRRFLQALMMTLAAVNMVVVTDHLIILLVAWFLCSIGLHHLLTFYPERPAASLAAHKKFIASRAAEFSFLAGSALVFYSCRTWSIEQLTSVLAERHEYPLSLHLAAVLIALAVIFKSAQIPVHGWILQVMEAPTPVSALLHAGVVNLGGFVMIRLAALIAISPVAQALLVTVGSVTAVLAGLASMTRISIKLRLAWSTCAQMGFMIMECGLGLYDLAFLHLIAHSIYKAYGFLAAGDTVEYSARRRLAPLDRGTLSLKVVCAHILAAPVVMATAHLSNIVLAMMWGRSILPASSIAIIGFCLGPMLWHRPESGGTLLVRRLGAMVFGVELYIGLHALASTVVAPSSGQLNTLLLLWSFISLALLFFIQRWVTAYPEGQLSKTLYPAVFAGFYLDESFTRLTHRLWPAGWPERQHKRPELSQPFVTSLEGGV